DAGAEIVDPPDEIVELVLPATGDDQACPFAGEEQRGRFADARGGAGDDGGLVVETRHGNSIRCEWSCGLKPNRAARPGFHGPILTRPPEANPASPPCPTPRPSASIPVRR